MAIISGLTFHLPTHPTYMVRADLPWQHTTPAQTNPHPPKPAHVPCIYASIQTAEAIFHLFTFMLSLGNIT